MSQENSRFASTLNVNGTTYAYYPVSAVAGSTGTSVAEGAGGGGAGAGTEVVGPVVTPTKTAILPTSTTTGATSVAVTGLTNGTAYTFTVTGPGAPTSPAAT